MSFEADGLQIAQDTTAPYTATWPTQDLPDGGYVVRATAYDADGNRVLSSAHLLNVWNSAAPPPTGAVTSPGDGATVSGTVTLSGTASHPSGVAQVGFNSRSVAGGSGGGGGSGSGDSTGTYTTTWDTTGIPNGTYRVWMNVRGNDGTNIYSPAIQVTVNN